MDKVVCYQEGPGPNARTTIHCPKCRTLQELPKEDFKVDERGFVKPEFVCLAQHKAQNGSSYYCEYVEFLRITNW